jgi:predicted nuclease of predicted toxin-antitoxin system
MTLWLDAQLCPSLAGWISSAFGIDATAVRDIGLRDADDVEIFQAARSADAIVVTKDRDFVNLLERHGPPPRVIWVTCGNTSNSRLRDLLRSTLPQALLLLEAGERMVEIGDAP